MAPIILSSKITLTYPLFCADFFEPPSDGDEPVTVVVAGGGGEGKSGVGNRIVRFPWWMYRLLYCNG